MVSETLREVTTRLDDGKYRVVSTLKEGRLFLAEKAGKRFVLKTAEGAKGLELLKREYEIALRLQHPFIASAIAWEENTPIGPAIVMEYIRGRSLAKYLQEKPSLEARKRVFGQLLEAVGAIHRQSIIHNDIQPENILITETDNDAKLIDFGFADEDAHILEKGLGGTRQYASPELLAHQDTDARSDIYSIGCLMRNLFPGRYCQISRKCCRTNPEKRYRNIDELKDAWAHRQRPFWMRSFLLVAALALGAFYLFNIRNQSAPAIPDIDEIPETVQVASNEAALPEPGRQPAPVSRRSESSSSGKAATPAPEIVPEPGAAFSRAEAENFGQEGENAFPQNMTGEWLVYEGSDGSELVVSLSPKGGGQAELSLARQELAVSYGDTGGYYFIVEGCKSEKIQLTQTDSTLVITRRGEPTVKVSAWLDEAYSTRDCSDYGDYKQLVVAQWKRDIPNNEDVKKQKWIMEHYFTDHYDDAFEVLLEGHYRIVERTETAIVLKNLDSDIPLMTWKQVR